MNENIGHHWLAEHTTWLIVAAAVVVTTIIVVIPFSNPQLIVICALLLAGFFLLLLWQGFKPRESAITTAAIIAITGAIGLIATTISWLF